MTLRHRSLPLFSRIILAILTPLALTLLAAIPAQAETTCKQVPGLRPELSRFLDELAAAQAEGQGTLPLTDVFFGFSYKSPDHLKALQQRITVELKRQDDAGGDYLNKGAEITVEGEFAADPTWVRMPREIRGRYAFDAPDGVDKDGVTLTYDPAHTVELGERHLGMMFFKAIHHSVITRDSVAFFLDDNAGPDPDRCYHVPD